MCTPAGQERFLTAVGDPMASRAAPPPVLDEAERSERRAHIMALAAEFRTGVLPP